MTRRSGSPPAGLTRHQDELEAALKALVADRPLPLYRMMGYHMGWVETTGEERSAPTRLRVHGSLVLTVCRTLGGGYKDALPHASAVEYLYNHLLIHEDIRDGNSERDGMASVWWSWGPAQAINTGDGMHALARLALFEMRSDGVASASISDALRVLDEANLDTCEGQYRDITLQERLDVGVDEYLAMSESQTGAVLACALRLGALAAGEASRKLRTNVGRNGFANVYLIGHFHQQATTPLPWIDTDRPGAEGAGIEWNSVSRYIVSTGSFLKGYEAGSKDAAGYPAGSYRSTSGWKPCAGTMSLMLLRIWKKRSKSSLAHGSRSPLG